MAHASLLKTCMRQGTDARNDLRKGENVKSPPFLGESGGDFTVGAQSIKYRIGRYFGTTILQGGSQTTVRCKGTF